MKENVLGRLLALLSVMTSLAFADEAKEKRRYNFCEPTRESLLREFTTDRPDKTEGPTMVDGGHFQFEMDFATSTRDRTSGIRTEAWNVAPFNLRVGLLNNTELSLILDSYLQARTDDRLAQTMSISSGVGDFTTRLKINFWGNDGGQTAFALFPFGDFPTNTAGLGNDSVEGAALFPLSAKLPCKIDMGMETGISFLRNDVGRNYQEEFVNSVNFGREIIGTLSGYSEFFSSVRTEDGLSWIGTVDLGLTHAVAENLQVDCGCNIGVTRAADNVNVFTGISVRF